MTFDFEDDKTNSTLGDPSCEIGSVKMVERGFGSLVIVVVVQEFFFAWVAVVSR